MEGASVQKKRIMLISDAQTYTEEPSGWSSVVTDKLKVSNEVKV